MKLRLDVTETVHTVHVVELEDPIDPEDAEAMTELYLSLGLTDARIHAIVERNIDAMEIRP